MSRSTRIPSQPLMGWSKSSSAGDDASRTRLRDIVPPIAAVLIVSLALMASGAIPPFATLTLSIALVVVAMAAVVVAGPDSVTPGMLAGVGLIGIAAITGLAGPLHASAPVLAAILAAGAAWTIGRLAAAKRNVLEASWKALVWAGIAYCAWMYLAYVSTVQGPAAASLSHAFDTAANTSVVFGLLAVVAMGRLLHVMKQIDAENPGRAQLIERLLREGIHPFLLLFASLALLVLTGSRPGMMFAGAVLLAYAWWDSLGITTRAHHGIRMRVAVIVSPMLAVGLAAWGVWQGWTVDDTIAAGIGDSEILPNLQRIQAYGAAWLESPVTGHGLGSAVNEGARFHNLHNAKAMLAPGGPQNLAMSWLVETGVLGLVLLLSALGAIHMRIVSAFSARRSLRSFQRMVIAASILLLLHGVTGSSLNIPAVGWMYTLLLGCACGLATGQRLKSP